ncbi:CPCC family cysteine-rich protein [Plantactinospora endophytica]|uniref:CPCC family cysteine-rich protein n=1 Tax=Plantactinospora endophytica TaxID=673535 RepID=UPI001EF1D628|nr:CPCC family cysteine-rich protein [Plantactinospora endophytica]
MGKHSIDVAVCLCCAHRTGGGTCPICFWTDDGSTEQNAGTPRGGPNGDLSLADARLNYAIYNASHPRYQDAVRQPRPEELP